MADHKQVSVQAIKGRFEQLGETSIDKDSNNTSKSCAYKRHNAPSSSGPSLPNNEDVISEIPDDDPMILSRPRSFSFENFVPPAFRHREVNCKPMTDVSRTQSFNQSKTNGRRNVGHLNSTSYHPNNKNNFSSFSEKQKLVESIVMNIRNDAVTARQKQDERKSKDFGKPKEMLSITSMFEKNVKNVLERGLYRKRSAKGSQSDIARSGVKSDKEIGNENVLKSEEDCNDKLPYFESESQLKQKYETKENYLQSHCELNIQPINSYFHTNNAIERSLFPKVDEAIVKSSENNTSPIRPPRRRVSKKSKAPETPSELWKEKATPNSLNRNKENQFRPNSLLEDQTSDDATLADYKPKRMSKSALNLNGEDRYQSSNEPTKEFTYEECCERNLENDILSDRQNTTNLTLESPSYFESNCQLKPPKSFGESKTISPDSSPPKKPPRTFAHDIYRTLKTEQGKEPNNNSTSKLTDAEIESLYTKPLKRLKEISTSKSTFPSPRIKNEHCPQKPAIAPKPMNILNASSIKRLSGAENNATGTSISPKENSDYKVPTKRNSSFRFSFKKHKKTRACPRKQTQGKGGGLVEKRFRFATKEWEPTILGNDKKVRFQPKNKSDIESIDEQGPIYATPEVANVKMVGQPKELHYMCSVLFNEVDTNNIHHSKDTQRQVIHLPSNPDHRTRLGLIGGLKNEFRQSCKLVQKRLKGAPNARSRGSSSVVTHSAHNS